MWSKMIYSPILIVFLSGFVFSADKMEYTCVNSTDGTAPTKININGIELECPQGFVCNVFHTSTEPCIEAAKVCENRFECVGEKVKISETLTLACSAGLICNQEKKYPCDPCVPRVCPEAAFRCPGPSDRDVSVMGFTLRCDLKSKCNKKNEHPCTPCIDRY